MWIDNLELPKENLNKTIYRIIHLKFEMQIYNMVDSWNLETRDFVKNYLGIIMISMNNNE
ncbi:hypothetical protein EG344_08110 [Chryseobacterium sp. G0162]|nr:hypothetical protein EG344_08110 [Chryseobacterium sp. G0162]